MRWFLTPPPALAVHALALFALSLFALALTACNIFDTAHVRLSYSRSTEGLPEAKPMPSVEIADGATYRLVAAPAKKTIAGVTTRLLTYNGFFPGPVMKVKQGSHIFINLVNLTDAPTTLHPHGLRVHYRFDGVPNYTQKPVAPGDSFMYRLDFPDPGLYWYHPHVRADYQADMGLYGTFLVEPQDPRYWGDSVHREEVLIVDDMLLDSGGITPYYPDVSDHSLMGRFGNTFLINGESDFTLQARRYERIRYFILNAANVRVFRFGFTQSQLRLIGSDYGRSRDVEMADDVLIAPGERYVAETAFEFAGLGRIQHRTPAKYLVTGPYYQPGSELYPPRPDSFPVLGQVQVSPDAMQDTLINSFYTFAGTTRFDHDFPFTETRELDSVMAKEPDFFLELTLTMDHNSLPMSLMPSPVIDTAADGTPLTSRNLMRMHPAELAKVGKLNAANHNDPLGLGIEWYDDMPEMNRRSNAHNVRWIIRDHGTGKENMDIRWQLKQGRQYHIRIWNNFNTMHPMAHTIHFHGQRAILIGASGVPDANPMWKDTFVIGMSKVADIYLEASNPGGWMGHCHIAEHAEASMMFLYRVDP